MGLMRLHNYNDKELISSPLLQYLSFDFMLYPHIMVILILAVLLSVVTELSVIAAPTEPRGLERRLGGRYFVDVNGVHDYCMLMPL